MSLPVLQLLNRVLGKGRVSGSKEGEYVFKCPVCKHRKRKLQVNYITQQWRCWVCLNTKGKSLLTLIKLGNATEAHIQTLKELLPGLKVKKEVTTDKGVSKLELPKEFTPLWEPVDSLQYKQALRYLKSRGLSGLDIIRYKIGYCTEGPYKGMVIIPSYDKNGELNFFTGRSFHKDAKRKHFAPSVSKNIIGFEYLINWALPITLCEGAFDAIAIKRNAIPLFGKEISDKLRTTILEQRVKHLYITLDTDATDKILELINYFRAEGINVYFTELKEKDPSELGFMGVQDALQNNSKQLSLRELLSKKLNKK